MRWLVLLVAACGSSAPPAPDAPTTFETPAFTPLLCAGGSAGDPSCPVNQVDDPSVVWFSFTLQPLSTTAYIPDFTFREVDATHLVHARFIVHTPTGDIADPGDALAGVPIIAGTAPAFTLPAEFAQNPLSLRIDIAMGD
jgi:hypothetical protein